MEKQIKETETEKVKSDRVAELEAEIEELKKENKKSLFQRVMNVLLWIVLIIWMVICLIDFYNVHSKKEPIFCLTKSVNKYSDGKVEMCTGLGYKVINYKRSSFKAIEFGPFWSKDRTAEDKKEEKTTTTTTKKTTKKAKKTTKTSKKKNKKTKK